MLVLRTNLYSSYNQGEYDNEEEKSSGWKKAAKIGAGVLATAGTLYGAKKGYLGTRAQMMTNAAIRNVGFMLKNDRLIKSGTEGFSAGAAKNYVKKTGIEDLLIQKYGSKAAAKPYIDNKVSSKSKRIANNLNNEEKIPMSSILQLNKFNKKIGKTVKGGNKRFYFNSGDSIDEKIRHIDESAPKMAKRFVDAYEWQNGL
jgi:hypothetical protein